MRTKGLLILSPNVIVEAHDARTGKLVHEERTSNRVVAAGRDVVRDLLCNVDHAPNYIAIGTDGTTPTDGDVALGTEVFRNAFTRTVQQASRCIFQLFVTVDQGNGYTWREIGLFRGTQRFYTVEHGGTPLYGGTLFARSNISPVVKDSNITATITWEIPIQSVV